MLANLIGPLEWFYIKKKQLLIGKKELGEPHLIRRQWFEKGTKIPDVELKLKNIVI